ncbi:hypothetical protein FACS1894181_04080 [Bacteroidia bacterium]|nr:hypothetical protein FACS1894181_04080 [Bacteroidia bacterium]
MGLAFDAIEPDVYSAAMELLKKGMDRYLVAGHIFKQFGRIYGVPEDELNTAMIDLSITCAETDYRKSKRQVNVQKHNLVEQAKNKQIEDLERTIQKLMKASINSKWYSLSFSKSGISDKLGDELANKGKYLYYFTADKSEGIEDAFLKAKESDKDTKYARFNGNTSEYLYVGCSNHLRKRFQEHCGKVHKATYAIRFADWLPDNIQITFSYMKIKDDPIVLQNIEEGLWKLMTPVFGKRGANPKETI